MNPTELDFYGRRIIVYCLRCREGNWRCECTRAMEVDAAVDYLLKELDQ